MKTALLGLALAAPSLALAGTPDAEGSLLDPDPSTPVALRLQAEVGALATLSHQLQFGVDGTDVSVPRDLGQSTLFPYLRFQADLDIGKKDRRNTISLLYQPLELRSSVAPPDDLQVGDITFPGERGINFRYGFSFWRGTWLYDTVKARDVEIGVGLGLQIRNANIIYEAQDGSATVSNRDVGPVPLLAFRGRGTLTGTLWMAGEISGFWAPIRILNGGNSDVEGAIADASLKLGLAGPKGADAFLALRYVGGGGVGTSSNPDPYTDGYVRNWLHLFSASVGFALR